MRSACEHLSSEAVHGFESPKGNVERYSNAKYAHLMMCQGCSGWQLPRKIWLSQGSGNVSVLVHVGF